MSSSRISIIIPCFNQARFLNEAIECAKAQTHGSKEIIVVDDGSTDDTARVASRHPDVKLLRQSNMGLAASRNSGITGSNGEYLVFLDADDYLEPDALAAGLNCFMEYPECAFVWGRHRIRNTRGDVREPGYISQQDGDAYARLLCGNHIAMHASVMYRRVTLELVGGFDASLPACEDYDMYLRIARRFPIVRHEEVIAEYRLHGSNMSLDSTMMLAAALRVLEGQRKYVDDNPKYRAAFAVGKRFWTDYYGVPCVSKIARELREFRFADAISDAASLCRAAGTAAVLVNAPVWIARQLASNRRRARGL